MTTKYIVVRELKEGDSESEVIEEYDTGAEAETRAEKESKDVLNTAHNVFVHVRREAR